MPLAPRIGFTASRKVGIAVVRNRARRRLKAAAEQVLPRHGAPGFDYVAIAREGTITRPFADLLADFATALQRLNEKHVSSPLGERRDPATRSSRVAPAGSIAKSDRTGRGARGP